jgi:hypothetical protein
MMQTLLKQEEVENWVQKSFGPQMAKMMEGGRKLREQLLYTTPSITSMIKLKQGRQQHVARMTIIINVCVQRRS